MRTFFSSIIMIEVMAIGVAPIIKRSFTVPHALKIPKFPPGKNNGYTVCPSAVTTISSSHSSNGIVAPSSNSSTPMPRLTFYNVMFLVIKFINAACKTPPAPCAICITLELSFLMLIRGYKELKY